MNSLNRLMGAILKIANQPTMNVCGDLRTGADTTGLQIHPFSEADIRLHPKFATIVKVAGKNKRIISFDDSHRLGAFIELNPLYSVNQQIKEQYDRWIQLAMINGAGKLTKRQDEISFILCNAPLTLKNFLHGNLWQTLFRLANTLHYLYIEVRPDGDYLRISIKKWGKTTDLQKIATVEYTPKGLATKTYQQPEITLPESLAELKSIAFFLYDSEANLFLNIDAQRQK